MEGYDVYTSDGDRLGHVVSRVGDTLVVEHGTLRKSCHPLPLAFVETDDDSRVVRTTLSKELIQDSPKVKNGEMDEIEVARYYGLAAGEVAPETEGYGALNADDPARTPVADAYAANVETAEEQRARIREGGNAPGEGPSDTGSSPGLLGGDRFRDANT